MKVYLSKEQYKELLKKGSITVGETIILFNEEDDYITPIEEIDTSQFVKSTNLLNKVYVHDYEKDTIIGYSSAPISNCFPVRDGAGNIALPEELAAFTDDAAVSKKYVDSKSRPLCRHYLIVMDTSYNYVTSGFPLTRRNTRYTPTELHNDSNALLGTFVKTLDQNNSTEKYGQIVGTRLAESGNTIIAINYFDGKTSEYEYGMILTDIVHEF